MDQQPKQARSKKRIEVILETAENILVETGVDDITIANISKISGLKRTSTYKFFQTPESIKAALAALSRAWLLYSSIMAVSDMDSCH